MSSTALRAGARRAGASAATGAPDATTSAGPVGSAGTAGAWAAGGADGEAAVVDCGAGTGGAEVGAAGLAAVVDCGGGTGGAVVGAAGLAAVVDCGAATVAADWAVGAEVLSNTSITTRSPSRQARTWLPVATTSSAWPSPPVKPSTLLGKTAQRRSSHRRRTCTARR